MSWQSCPVCGGKGLVPLGTYDTSGGIMGMMLSPQGFVWAGTDEKVGS